MKKNVGTIDALFRLTVGFFGLAWGISKMVKSPRREMPILVTFLSAMKIAEGMTRFCPGLALFKVNTVGGLDKDRKVPYSTIKFARTKIEEPPPLASKEQEKGVLQ